MEHVSNTINAMIHILQKTIGNMEEEITVMEEMEIVKQYVYISQIRYGDNVQVDYSVAEECRDSLLPKMVIQPFIENAFFHGFQEKKEGRIRIFIRRQGEDITCEIMDDGDGMSLEGLTSLLAEEKKQHLTGIGIPNVDERIRIMYGESYGILIRSIKGTGTSITIRIPFHLKKIQ